MMREYLKNKISEATGRIGTALPADKISLEKPKIADHGDLSTNTALMLAKAAGKSPMEVAGEIINSLGLDETLIESAEAAPPGFINFRYGPRYRVEVLQRIISERERYGSHDAGRGMKVNVEFVSANPTGPLSIGHGRNAVFGDTIARLLEFCGYDVSREYYFNNAGRQMRMLGETVRAHYLMLLNQPAKIPEDGYQGEYVKDIAQALIDERGDSLAGEEDILPFKSKAETLVFEDIAETLTRLEIKIETYYNEADLYEKGQIEAVLSQFKEKNLSYEKDGAVWLKASGLGMEQDRVIVKSSGEPTYRLPDIAYHITKFERGFEWIIDILGADHHAAYPDVLAGLNALGYDAGKVTVLLHQFVTLVKDGKKVKMSTRKANFVTLDELIEKVGRDVVRYFFLMRSMSSHLNFDLELALKESDDNPVYYIQYAHARIASILRLAEEKGVIPAGADLYLLGTPEEKTLVNLLGEFPVLIEFLLKTLEPHHISVYLTEVATMFSRFYVAHRVVSDDIAISSARLTLCRAVQQVLDTGLSLLGITAPDRM